MTAAFALVILYFVFWSGPGGPEEDKVRKMVEDIEKAAEERDIKGVLRHFSDDYTDNHGNDLRGLKRLLLAQFFRGEEVSVIVSGVRVELKGDVGLLDVKAALVLGREVGDVVPEDAAGFAFNSVIVREGGRWKVRSVKWQRVGVLGLL